jgi:hypothetical protein
LELKSSTAIGTPRHKAVIEEEEMVRSEPPVTSKLAADASPVVITPPVHNAPTTPTRSSVVELLM